MTAALSAHELIARHRSTLDQALEAIRTRAYWSPHPEHPKAYGENGSLDAAAGKAAFDALLGTRLDLGQPGTDDWVGGETSPYGVDLGVTYPHADLDVLLPAMKAGQRAWRDAGAEQRAVVCLEILKRISDRTHEFAHAVMHTSGQAFMMAFQAGGPHAQDRGLEAVAYAYVEQVRTPDNAEWTKPQGKRDPLAMNKQFTPVPRGIALLIGCNTFPTWNGYPGLFASLATGNAVLVKPHPRAVLPLALTVQVAREVLTETGFDPNLIALAAERPGEGIAKALATRPEIRIIDYTGSTEFGDWLEANARQAQVYTEKAGVNTVVVHSTSDYKGMLSNLAFSLSLYSGQMCTTPQNLLVPRTGISTDQGPKSYDEVVADLAKAVDGLLGTTPGRTRCSGDRQPGCEGAVGGRGRAGRGRPGVPGDHQPGLPGAVVRTPVIVKLDGAKPDAEAAYMSECFGPVSFAVAVDSASDAVALLRRTVREKGAMTVGAYTTDPEVEQDVQEACLEEAAQLSLNLTGGVYVNQTAAFSDFHGSGVIRRRVRRCATGRSWPTGSGWSRCAGRPRRSGARAVARVPAGGGCSRSSPRP
ncbi:phenylacetic acid degradation protein PaaN [Streptomyces tuirus]|uniref:Phenylacetic acid degradation protein PaaN n=1 Tax=Streptomyces tuirus TaxID=68278 RepID=A0A941J4R5_9ACTN|nr:phenylacetic acid degradation protein PaaN [Streptomyces tuirus]